MNTTLHTLLTCNLNVGHCNIQGGLTNLTKTLEVQELIFREKIDILGINETNLKSDIATSTLNLPLNFDFLRCDRPNDSGRGGCGVLVNKNVNYRAVNLNITCSDISKIESIWIELVDANIYICCFYRSHNFSPLDIFLDYMTECMMKLQGKKVIWIGDVNVNQNSLTDLEYKKLDITMKMFGMIQTVTDITRIAYLNGRLTQSTIDVVMTNCYSQFLDCTVLDDRIGDHQALKITLNIQVKKASKFQKILIRDQSLNNLKDLGYFLGQNSDYSSILSCNDVDQATDGLNHHIRLSYEHFCPVKQIKCKSNYLANPSNEFLSEVKEKKRIYRKHRKLVKKLNKFVCKCKKDEDCNCKKAKLSDKCVYVWETFKKQRNYVTNLSRKTRRDNIVQDLTTKSTKNDLKGIWKTIKHASNIDSKNVHPFLSNLNANVVNQHFATIGQDIQDSIATKNTDNFMNFMPPSPECNFSVFEEVSEQQLKEYILSIPSDKSINDIMPMKVYKYMVPHIVEPMVHIVNLSLKTGIMPAACKVAIVSPILKGGDVDDPNNYRPISILPLLGKCIEYFVNQQLSDYVEQNGLLTDNQYGFRKDHSTTFLMLELFDKIFMAKESGKKPAIVFLDIKKAFDSVNHDVLLKKLKHYGVDGYVIKWFESYLTNRLQCTKLKGMYSSALPICTGVPQGSILGPILFSLFINDLGRNCRQSNAYLFADDSALYFNNVTRGVYSSIAEDMQTVYEWFRINKLKFNTQKTSLLIFDRNTDLDDFIMTLENEVMYIKETKSQKYLGLMIDSQLTFQDHIDYVKSKVAKRIGALYRSKKLLPLKYRKMFVNALMLPQFDYLDVIWCRTGKTKLNALDIIYKKVAKIALDVDRREPSVTVYKDMKWLPLHLRRQLHLSSYMHKIINGQAPSAFVSKFAYVSGGSRDAERCNLCIPRSKTHKSFPYLGAKCWNSIPFTVRTEGSTDKFC